MRPGDLFLLSLCLASAADDTGLVDVMTLDSRWRLEMRYASADNFTGKKLYDDARCYLRREVASMLVQAQAALDGERSGTTFLLFDCYRPVSVQRRMWELVRGTPASRYVASPDNRFGAVHTFGAAVDLTLMDVGGRPLDMGTGHDHFGEASAITDEDDLVERKVLTRSQVQNRRLLRRVMRRAGFRTIRAEWWHFDAWRGDALRARYAPLDVPFSALVLPTESDRSRM